MIRKASGQGGMDFGEDAREGNDSWKVSHDQVVVYP